MVVRFPLPAPAGRTTMSRILTALLCLAALAGLLGCGESDQEQAREVVQDYADARNAKDYEAVCEQFSEKLKQELATGDCPAFVREQSGGAESDQEVTVVDVRVRDDVATADLDVTSEAQGPVRVSLRLERQDGEWRIAALQ